MAISAKRTENDPKRFVLSYLNKAYGNEKCVAVRYLCQTYKKSVPDLLSFTGTFDEKCSFQASVANVEVYFSAWKYWIEKCRERDEQLKARHDAVTARQFLKLWQERYIFSLCLPRLPRLGLVVLSTATY